MKVELDRECKSCGVKLKQHVSFSENNGRITIRVYRCKCPGRGSSVCVNVRFGKKVVKGN